MVDIEPSGGGFSAFTVTTDAGEERFLIDDSIEYGFDLAHLIEHRDDRLPVEVRYETRGGKKVALRIDDA